MGRLPMGKTKNKKPQKIKPIAFGEKPGKEPFNASEIVAIDDGRFLFCDNNIGDSLFELRLDAGGSLAGPIEPRPIRGIAADKVDDLEGMTIVSAGNRQFIFANPSLCLKRRKGNHRKKSERGKPKAARNCLLRIRVDGDELEAEILTGFREWVVDNAPILGKSWRYLPDDGGLNVEGLSWSSKDSALLFGVRSPVADGQPIVLRVVLKKVDGPWDLSNLEMLPPVCLKVERGDDEQGIRTIGSDQSRGVWLVVTGNSTSHSKAPFRLYAWDGNVDGNVRRFEKIRFY